MKMGFRRRARELAVQFLYQIDTTGEPYETALEKFKLAFAPPQDLEEFFQRLVEGVIGHRTQIDHLIERFSHNWRLARMSKVDRNILRLAVFEMLYGGDIPSKVSINEAVDLGKTFGQEDSGAFINGILDSVRKYLDSEVKKCES